MLRNSFTISHELVGMSDVVDDPMSRSSFMAWFYRRVCSKSAKFFSSGLNEPTACVIQQWKSVRCVLDA